MKKEKDFSFKAFKVFLQTKCYDEKKYGEGKYDRKIWRWFRLGKPLFVDFLKRPKKF